MISNAQNRTLIGEVRHNAFISYSHAAEGNLAPALQRALHRFAKPLFKLRTMRVFRDETSLFATPELWSSIGTTLPDSQFFMGMLPEYDGVAKAGPNLQKRS